MSDVLTVKQGKAGIITLNRPEALNALNLSMIEGMTQALLAWRDDEEVSHIIVEGAGERAFCSGGDVKTVALEAKAKREGKSDGALCYNFFAKEYQLNHLIFHYPKPYISLIDGIVMGGGKGISAHGSHRVVTEKTLFAMPETSIGFFPDVGGGWFLPRCQGQTGTYLALTSARANADDVYYLGFATHLIASADVPAVRAALIAAHAPIDEILKRYQKPSAPSTLEQNRAEIDKHFAFDDARLIAQSLAQSETAFAQNALAMMQNMSPVSVQIALKQIRQGGKMTSFAEVMQMEFRLSQYLVHTADFYEGIRAALIDKDRRPQWQVKSLAAVEAQILEEAFATLGEMELRF
jgi:enoyl-CoA hydratase